ncbi:DUF6701 domain-containing protein [Vibrio coralliirubri]|uniref:DUF6701 domain-containing protein n=1 Tax=Vibrio coralliirubri TaxID=1516159 RepID=UPI000635B0C4|nr:DUF6701 domain-containing protein [Vibrio coralliirubri]CDT91881.1 MSHA biogenesis protein MshQ [Vibrio coralliirubri]
MKHLSIILTLLFVSFPSFADFSSSQCSSLHAGDDFSVWFKLAPSSGEDTIYATKRNGGSPTPIWSNDSGVRNPVIDDNETSNGEFYEVWLEYESVTNKSGWLTYNLWEGSSWRQVGTRQYADLSGLSAAIAVSGDGASELKCDDDITQPPPSYAPQALYQFGVAQCTGSECKIPLNKPFTNTPLVFVMPTIDPSNPDSDAPATLVVTNVTKTEATIEQIKAPKNGGGSDLTSQPMTEVSYLAIEPGVADFNGHQVIAGYLETDEASAKSGSNDNDRVFYSDFGGGTFSSNPVVLHQIQTRNNSTKWMTSGKVKRTNERSYVDLFLELSASHNSNLDYEDEKIAFLATLPTNSNLEVDGYKVQFARGYDTPSQNGNDPMLDGCEDKYATTSLTNLDGIVANKQERAGGHGGWLRRCNINNGQVSFVVDEDFRDRTHIPEEVGYFAFELEDIPLDICDVAPHVVQSWGDNSRLLWTSNTPSIQIEGTYQSSGQVGIWVDPANPTVNPKTQCDGKECVENSSLYMAEPNIVDLDLPTGQNVDAGWQEINLVSGKYNTVSAGGSGTINLTGDTYYIEHLIVGASGKMILSQDTKIYVNSFELSGAGQVINNDFKLSIWAENYKGHNASVQVERNLNALIFSRDKVLVTGGNGLINGRVTAKNIELRPDGKIIDDGQFCPVQPSDYQLDLTPNKDFSLLCETPQVTVTVTDTQGKPATESIEVYITTPTGINVDSVIEGRHNGGNSYSTNSSGILTLGLDADSIGTYKIEAELASDSNQSDSGDFLVSLYKFEASDIYAVAGLGASFNLKALACKDDTATPVSGYQGDKTLNVSDFSLVNPTSAQGAVDGNLLVKSKSDWSDTSVIFEFDSSAQTTGSVIYSEAGKVSFKLSDPTFECPTGYDCEDNDGDSWDSLEGVVEVYVRPWKFAICTNKSSDGNSNEKDSDSFIGARESFDVYARPIKHTDSSAVCTNDNLLTNNYFKSTASVEVTTTLDTPLITVYPDAKLGDLTPVAQLTKQISSNDQANKGYKFDSLKYSEAGSFNFIATETGSFYGSILGGLSGSKSIGRFYPKFFVQGTPEWIVADQNNIAYLSQPYDSTVHQVYPMASGESDTDDALNNYRFFSSDLQASFGVLDDSNIDNGFLLDTDVGSWSADRKHWLLNDSAAVLQRVTDSDDVSRRDAPFNTSDASSIATNFGLTVTGVDPVSFTDSDPVTDSAAFPVQPPARYGRMALDDIGGSSGTTLTVPLRAEFWDGSEFVVNDDDNRSTFNGSNTCKQVIWHSEGVTTTLASLSGSGSVDHGEEDVTANQNTPAGTDAPREQVRLWLRMDASEPDSDGGNNISCSGGDQDQPWLRYNWRQLGDEDPSTVVTFGIYRGNDRVIYRGESGLTGQ